MACIICPAFFQNFLLFSSPITNPPENYLQWEKSLLPLTSPTLCLKYRRRVTLQFPTIDIKHDPNDIWSRAHCSSNRALERKQYIEYLKIFPTHPNLSSKSLPCSLSPSLSPPFLFLRL